MRGIAAGMIVVVHVAGVAYFGSPSKLWTYLIHFDAGVTIFFLISGFLLYRPFIAARLEGRPPLRIRDYARRRLLRIVPAYWVALTVLGLWPGLVGLWGPGWWRYYAFGQVYSPATFGLGIPPAWTLCIEMTFYVALPFLAAGLAALGRGLPRERAIRRELIGLSLLAAASIALQATAFSPTSSLPTSTLPPFLDWFAYGMMLAVVSVAWRHREPRPLALLARRPWLPWLACAVVFWFVCTQLGLPRPSYFYRLSTFTAIARHLLYAVCAALLLLPALFYDSAGGWPRRLMANRAVAWFGVISYGVFIYHYSVIDKLHLWGVDTWLPAGFPASAFISLLLPALAVSIAVAAVSYRLVERPTLRFKDRRRASAPRAAPAPAEPAETAVRV